MFDKLDRHTLNSRHQLSHEQIDHIRNERKACNFPEEKLQLMVKYQAFLNLLDAFQLANLPVIVLKGFPLSEKIYGDPFRRITGDIDLLLEPQTIKDAIQILHDNGFVAAIHPFPMEKKKAEGFMKHKNQFSLLHPVSGIVVELHWRLFYFPVISTASSFHLVKENLTERQLSGRNFSVLNNELELIYLVIHGGMHGWNRLKWLIDVNTLVSGNQFDAHEFSRLAQRLKAQTMIGLYNQLTGQLPGGGAKLPGPEKSPYVVYQTAKKMICSNDSTSFQSAISLLRYFCLIFMAFPGVGYKIRLIRFACRSIISRQPSQNRLLNWKNIFQGIGR